LESEVIDRQGPIIPYPTGRFFFGVGALSQALRARLRSGCPCGDALLDRRILGDRRVFFILQLQNP
jgi:hypothetical protein